MQNEQQNDGKYSQSKNNKHRDLAECHRDILAPVILCDNGQCGCQIIQEMQIPFAYDHFAEGESPDPPFICYLLPGSNNFSADGRVYYKISEVHIELYTDLKDLSVENAVEAVLDSHGIFYQKSEVWIESERLYEVLYTFEMEV